MIDVNFVEGVQFFIMLDSLSVRVDSPIHALVAFLGPSEVALNQLPLTDELGLWLMDVVTRVMMMT